MGKILEILLTAIGYCLQCLITIAGFYCMMGIILQTVIQ